MVTKEPVTHLELKRLGLEHSKWEQGRYEGRLEGSAHAGLLSTMECHGMILCRGVAFKKSSSYLD